MRSLPHAGRASLSSVCLLKSSQLTDHDAYMSPVQKQPRGSKDRCLWNNSLKHQRSAALLGQSSFSSPFRRKGVLPAEQGEQHLHPALSTASIMIQKHVHSSLHPCDSVLPMERKQLKILHPLEMVRRFQREKI